MKVKPGPAIAAGLVVLACTVTVYRWLSTNGEYVLAFGVMFAVMLIVGTGRPQPAGTVNRPPAIGSVVDDFGRPTTAEHPWIVAREFEPASVQAEVALVGADEFLARCTLVAGPDPDPGHPGGMPIALWRPPADYGAVLVLECFNGTPEPDGTFERLAVGVSAEHKTPMAAAAASYGVTPDVYAQLSRRV